MSLLSDYMELYSFESIFFVVSIQESQRPCSESIFPSKQTIPFCCCKYPPNSSSLNLIITLKQLQPRRGTEQSQNMANCVRRKTLGSSPGPAYQTMHTCFMTRDHEGMGLMGVKPPPPLYTHTHIFCCLMP